MGGHLQAAELLEEPNLDGFDRVGVLIFIAIVGAKEADVRVRTDLYGHIDDRVSGGNLDVQTDVGPLAGVLIKPNDRLRFGFSWRQELKLNIMQGLAADAVASLDGGLITLPIRLGIPIMDAYRPEAYAFGASYDFTDTLLFVFDVTQYRIDRPFKGLEDHQISAGILAGYLHDLKSASYFSSYGLRTLQAPLYDSAADSLVVNLGIGGEVTHDFLYLGAGFMMTLKF